MNPTGSIQELAHRAGDGVDVSLLWSRHDSRLTVAVADARTGEAFQLTPRAEKALDVYYHPFAYAPPRPPRRAH
jgi:hypothetical protein